MRQARSVMGLLAVGAIWSTAQAATITYLGEDTTTHANWLNVGVAKSSTYDPNHDNQYGSGGYYLEKYSAADVSPNGNKRGSILVSSLPSYIGSVNLASALIKTWSGTNYAPLNDPTNPTGPNTYAGFLYTSPQTYSLSPYFTIALAQPSTFVLGIIESTHDTTNYNATALQLRQTAGGSADSGLVNLATPELKNAHYAFFSVSGATGDTFQLSVAAYGGVTGMTFEAIPEPAGIAVLCLAGGGLLVRRRGTPGVQAEV